MTDSLDVITSKFAQLNIQPELNFRECPPDPDQPTARPSPPQATSNEWFYQCYNLVLNTICMYACLFNINIVKNVIYGYKRPPATPESAEEFFERYNVQDHDIEKDSHYYAALDIVTEWFRPKQLIHPVHFTDLRWYPWNLSTNAELPFSSDPDLKKKLQKAKELNIIDNARMSFHNCYQEIFIYCRNYTHRIKEGLHVPLHHTTMHQKPALNTIDKPDKVRSVFGVSKCLIFIEAMFLWPLFSTYHTDQNTPLLWGYETLNGGWSRLNTEYNTKYSSFKPVFNLDWSEFDMYFYYSVWRDIRAKVKTYFCFCGRYHPTRTHPQAKTQPYRLERLWTFLGHAYENTCSLTPLGRIIRKLFAGMPSGIFGTQFYDSFYNAVMVVTILLALGFTVTSDHFIKLMGDDVLFGLLQMLPIDQWADFLEAFSQEAKRRFNSKLSPDKCGTSPGIHGATVLSYENCNGYPIRDPEQLLAQLLHPRSLRDSPPRLMARAIGIYYASAGEHRLRPICEHIFSELKSLGYTTHERTFQSYFAHTLLLSDPSHIDLTHFPSRTEVFCRLMRPSTRDPEIQSLYWPLDHFLLEAGSCLH